MSRITRELALAHTRAGVLRTVAPHVISQFEADLIEDIGRRRRAFGPEARVTDVEAEAMRSALAGLERACRQIFSGQAIAFGQMLDRVEAERP